MRSLSESNSGAKMDRRSFVQATICGGALLAGAMMGLPGCGKSSKPELAGGLASASEPPPLPYGEGALAPYISMETVRTHYQKHHAGYVAKTAQLVKGTLFENHSLLRVMRETVYTPDRAALFNNAAQAWNHEFYWSSMRPGGGEPDAAMMEKIKRDFGSLDNFKKEFTEAAMNQFGSGWAWLALENGRMTVLKTGNAANPVIEGKTPLLTIDVWEHAYYVDYRNRRADYVKAVIDNLLNWDFAAVNLARA